MGTISSSKTFVKQHAIFLSIHKNSEYPRIFRVTGANQNARKLLSSDLVNTNNYYCSRPKKCWFLGLQKHCLSDEMHARSHCASLIVKLSLVAKGSLMHLVDSTFFTSNGWFIDWLLYVIPVISSGKQYISQNKTSRNNHIMQFKTTGLHQSTKSNDFFQKAIYQWCKGWYNDDGAGARKKIAARNMDVRRSIWIRGEELPAVWPSVFVWACSALDLLH